MPGNWACSGIDQGVLLRLACLVSSLWGQELSVVVMASANETESLWCNMRFDVLSSGCDVIHWDCTCSIGLLLCYNLVRHAQACWGKIGSMMRWIAQIIQLWLHYDCFLCRLICCIMNNTPSCSSRLYYMTTVYLRVILEESIEDIHYIIDVSNPQ